ncbi:MULTISPECIES: M1 family aminopeptidase [unclassified Robiginitalea]|uniref:M1 family aminopeptidase n=1 Tax=Robiginitalea TaxID=252306 RepID=UPI002349D4A1|nr:MULTISPECIES: M1 family aminopeptidase [unclassified Robiginitalea]MDC6355641.1 M1 family aminopeptidase [Robiginitalea sp. PM2]MDC6376052.1 M1 family aminopeptidase [Robiginitalea sp. SP8]
MRRIVFLCRVIAPALFVMFSGCQPEPVLPGLDYKISRSSWDSLPALQVRIAFQPAENGKTRLLFADNAWGQDSLWNTVKDLRMHAGQGTSVINRDSGWVEISHATGTGPLEVGYKIIQDQPLSGDPSLTYRPIVQPEYFHVFAHNLLMVPEHYQAGGKAGEGQGQASGEGFGNRAAVRLSWEGWEAPGVVHNSFGSQQPEQDLGAIDLDRFMSAVFVGGDFRVLTADVKGNTVHLAIRGDWIPFSPEEVMDLLRQTLAAQRDFWQDHSQPYFTVTMRPFSLERGSSYQGTGLTNSFATSVSNNASTSLDQLVYLFNHELMHNWIGHAIENESEEAQYWFSEGFTEYYTAKNIAAYGIAGKDWGYYIEAVNEKIRQLAASPVRTAPNSDITYENFWSSRDYEKLPYYRGFLFAFYLDQQIRAVSERRKSLDNLMRDLLKDSREKGFKLSGGHFVKRANAYLVEDLQPFFHKYIENGELLPLEDYFRDLELDFKTGADLFHLGFTFSPERDSVISVDPESAAFASGVRKGDRVLSRSIYMGATDKEVELVVRRNGREYPVSYLPRRKEPIPQLLDTPENREALSK